MIRQSGFSKNASILLFLGIASYCVLAGCNTEAYCFSCEDSFGPDGSKTDGGSDTGEAGFAGGTADTGTINMDSGCQAQTQTDPQNCGGCGTVCSRTGAIPSCVVGKCQFACADGRFDLNADLTKDSGNGCEYACVKSSNTELCNGLDDNCDGQYDEGSVCNNALNCGTFGKACLFPHSTGECKNGVCVEGSCITGFYPDPNKPMPNCDYSCSVTNGGKEICDNRDNDCNQLVDDSPDTASDPLNCGGCGQSCFGKFPNSAPLCANSLCILGTCADGYFNKDNDDANGCEYSCKDKCNYPFATGICQADGTCDFGTCMLGHYNLNNDPIDGCEYSCILSNGGVEICDGVDNNCNNQIDEGFDLKTDALNCGACNNDCGPFFPHSVVNCSQGACAFVKCQDGYYPQNGSSTGGCQYSCSVTNSGIEICDNKDNDCNGIVDDNVTDVGGSCATNQPGVCAAGTFRCIAGASSCVASVAKTSEVCDGKDNDCNGTVDDGPDGTAATLPGMGFACGKSQVGECKLGVTTCELGVSICKGQKDAVTETCNNKDDDCNGITDDNPSDATGACGSAIGTCKPGTKQCVVVGSSAVVQCVGAVGPETELCDGTPASVPAVLGNDENCSGQADEGCAFPKTAPSRLDTTNSTQGQYSTFQLTSASIGSEFLVAYTDSRSGNSDIWVRTSSDTGATWGAADSVALSTGNIEVEPSVAMRAGRAYIVYSNFNGALRRIYASASNTPYTTWTAGTLVRDPSDTNIDCYSPIAILAKSVSNVDWVAAIWSEIGGTPIVPTRNVRLSYSKDSGTSWSAPILINSGAGANKAELPSASTDDNGVVYVPWRDKRIAGLAQAYFAKVDLNAATPSVSTALALQPNVANATAADLSIAASGNNVHVAWADLRTTKRVIRVSSSSDAGTTWTQDAGKTDGQIVNPDGTAFDADAPSISALGNRVVVAWEDTRSGKSDIRVNHSDDIGKTWGLSTPRVDTGDQLGQNSSFAPKVKFGTGTRVFVTWKDLRFPSSSVLANLSLDSGLTWHPNSGLAYRMDIDTLPSTAGSAAAADSQSPLILTSTTTNQASVVWVDFRNATGQNGLNGDIWTRFINP